MGALSKLTSYVLRDYTETSPVEVLGSVAPFTGVTDPVLICYYQDASVMAAFPDLYAKADQDDQFFYEIRLTVDIGESIPGRIHPKDLDRLGMLNLNLASKELNNLIEDVLGYRINYHPTRTPMYTVFEIMKIHQHKLFQHLDIIVFPAATSGPVKPNLFGALFYPDAVVELVIENPNKGTPFEVVLPELGENPLFSHGQASAP